MAALAADRDVIVPPLHLYYRSALVDEACFGVLELVDAHQSILELTLRRADLDAEAMRAWLALEAAVGVELVRR